MPQAEGPCVNFVAPVVESVSHVRAAGNANVLPDDFSVSILSADQQ